jgi:hypothetical protein
VENQLLAGRAPLGAWIGANDIAVEGQWRWQHNSAQFWQGGPNGSAVGGAYRNWSLFEPNNLLNEDCALTNALGAWSDDNCSALHSYLCEGVVDTCPTDPNKSVPGQCGCGIADTDGDADGTADCRDGCPSDASKSKPGVCGCGVSDLDPDRDGTPTCKDECPDDSSKVLAGDCGCSDAPKPVGAVCGDGLCAANSACDGAGSCGNPGDCGKPGTNCIYRSLGGKDYWICKDRRTFGDARQHCQSLGMDLAVVESEAEDTFLTSQLSWCDGHVFIGATDQATEGEYTYVTSGTKFWSGGSSGQPVGGAFTNWLLDAPNADLLIFDNDCVVKDPILTNGKWQVVSCGSAQSYVCEATDACGGCAPSADPCVVSFCDEQSGQCLTAPNDGASRRTELTRCKMRK